MPRWRILVADDEVAVRRLVVATLGTGSYEVLEASDGTEALGMAREHHPHLALLDVNMPGMDGFQLCRLLKDDPATASIKSIILTARGTEQDFQIASEAGAEGYFTKPFSPVKLLDRISSLLGEGEAAPEVAEGPEAEPALAQQEAPWQDLSTSGEKVARGQVKVPEPSPGLEGLGTRLPPHLVRPDSLQQRQLLLYAEDLSNSYRDLHSAYDATLEALVGALDVRDAQTEGHSRRVVELCLAMGRKLDMAGPALEDLRRGAILHDVGKIGVPDAILRKPGPLTQAEWQEMRKHPEYGARILSTVTFLSGGREIVLHHHEHWDGGGYPVGLAGTEIPLGARLFALADSWDAMTSDRPYRRALRQETARAEILRGSGTQFDPALAELFLGLDLSQL